MKRIVLSAVMVCLCIGMTNAQLRFGIKAGANLTNLSGFTTESLINDIKGATHYQAGVLAQIKMGKFFALQPEILFTTKGAELSNDGTNAALNFYETASGQKVPNSLTLKTSYLEVPINFQAGISLGKIARVYGQVGPYFSYLIADKIEGKDDFYAAYKNFLANAKDGATPLNNFDYGIGIGAGVEVLFLQLAVKYDFGFAEFKEVSKTILTQDIDVNPLFSSLKNRNLSISLAFLF